jgi:DNA-binding CsgD family transcriptional regulator
VKGFEYIYPYNVNNVFLGSEKGVYHINYKNYLQHVSEPGILIGNVRVIGKIDSLIFGGYPTTLIKGGVTGNDQTIIKLPNSLNSIHFEYSCPLYGQEKNIEYSYQLAGFEEKWSGWIKKTEKDYTNLPYGTYTFNVKARTNLGNESKPVSYSFIIEPAWYQTKTAYLFYLSVLLITIYFIIKLQEKKFANQQLKYAKEQDHLKYMYQLEMDLNEKEIIKLQNEKLESDVNFKNKELANATMHLVERGKVISKIKEEFFRFQKNSPSAASSGDFKRIIHLLSDAEKNDTYWDQFVSHFDDVYGNYLTLLKQKYPALSATDLKLCAYLRVNLSSKEISQLMNISVRGVEIARYRLRKKLLLATDENLCDFLIAIKIEQ